MPDGTGSVTDYHDIQNVEGICNGLRRTMIANALTAASAEGVENLQQKFDSERNNPVTSTDRALTAAARAVANAQRRVAQSESGRIGERLNGVPCMAQQGFNGSSGFDINNFDLGILGAQGFDAVNALTR